MMSRFLTGKFLIGLMVLGAGVAFGQDYPYKPIRILTSAAGGTSDTVSRQIAEGISGPLGQPVIVDNRGGGTLAQEIVAKATPDGYTLLVDGGSFWIAPLLQPTPYDVVRDFSPITLLTRSTSVLVVHLSVPAKTVKELIALAKAKPGALNYASSVTGSAPHLGAELFKTMAGVNIVRINYKGGAPALNGILSGEAQMYFINAATAIPHIKSGRLRALAVTSAEPSALLPGVPTVAETLPGYESGTLQGIFAPAKTPPRIINRLNQEIVRVLKRADVKERFLSLGVEPGGSSPQEFAAMVKSEITKWGKLIKNIGRAE